MRGAKYGCASLAPVKHNAFFDNGERIKVACGACTNAGFVLQADVKPNTDLVESAVEGHLIHADGGANNFGVYGAHRGRVIYQFTACGR